MINILGQSSKPIDGQTSVLVGHGDLSVGTLVVEFWLRQNKRMRRMVLWFAPLTRNPVGLETAIEIR